MRKSNVIMKRRNLSSYTEAELDRLAHGENLIPELDEASEWKRGKLTVKTTYVVGVNDYDAMDIKKVRGSLYVSQNIFADLLGVSVKSVHAWEQGRGRPSGPVRRLLQLLEKRDTLLLEMIELTD